MTLIYAFQEAKRAKLHKELDRVLKELIELDAVPWASMQVDLAAGGRDLKITITVSSNSLKKV
jgi:hypothetical protein